MIRVFAGHIVSYHQTQLPAVIQMEQIDNLTLDRSRIIALPSLFLSRSTYLVSPGLLEEFFYSLSPSSAHSLSYAYSFTHLLIISSILYQLIHFHPHLNTHSLTFTFTCTCTFVHPSICKSTRQFFINPFTRSYTHHIYKRVHITYHTYTHVRIHTHSDTDTKYYLSQSLFYLLLYLHWILFPPTTRWRIKANMPKIARTALLIS